MTPLFKKLNFKDQEHIHIIQAPPEFKREMEAMKKITVVTTSLVSAKNILFVLAFVTRQQEVDDLAGVIGLKVVGDGIVWLAYPKQSSKKYSCEFNRDNGWQKLGELGFEPVRMVAIDENWSALRFRRAEHIKTMKRSFAMSDTGKEKVAANKKRGTSK